MAQEIEDAIVARAAGQPAFGQVRAANELQKQGLVVSPAGVRRVWRRHDSETMNKRLKALDAKMAEERLILTEAQLSAMEKAKTEKEGMARLRATPRILRRPGYLLYRQPKGGWTHRPADLHRHLHKGCFRQAL